MDSKRFTITIDEIAVTDGSKSHCGVRRCRDTELTSSSSGKRRKFDLLQTVQSEIECRNGVDVNSSEDVVSSAEFDTSDHVSSSTCVKNCLRLDLKVETRFENENETSMSGNGGLSTESTPSSEICFDSDKMESSLTMKKKPAPPPALTSDTAVKIPTAEIDEFFSVAEKKEQKRFSVMYNFDIVNDVPIEGRYQWVQIKP